MQGQSALCTTMWAWIYLASRTGWEVCFSVWCSLGFLGTYAHGQLHGSICLLIRSIDCVCLALASSIDPCDNCIPEINKHIILCTCIRGSCTELCAHPVHDDLRGGIIITKPRNQSNNAYKTENESKQHGCVGNRSLSVHDTLLCEREMFLREVGSCRYSAFTYYMVKSTLDAIFLRILPTLTYSMVVYWLMGLQMEPEKVSWFLLFCYIIM